jgi:putative FmdB family regulatory protein
VPIYDYRCGGCHRRISLWFRTYAAADEARCPHCGSTDLARLVTRFAVARSEERRLEDLASPEALGALDSDDPRAVARWAREMGRELGDELGDDYDEMIDRLEAGELPDDEPAGEEPADTPASPDTAASLD